MHILSTRQAYSKLRWLDWFKKLDISEASPTISISVIVIDVIIVCNNLKILDFLVGSSSGSQSYETALNFEITFGYCAFTFETFLVWARIYNKTEIIEDKN